MTLLTRVELDKFGCATPDCGHDHSELYLHQSCHPGAGLYAHYVKASGNLVLECRECEHPVATIAVSRWRADWEKQEAAGLKVDGHD